MPRQSLPSDHKARIEEARRLFKEKLQKQATKKETVQKADDEIVKIQFKELRPYLTCAICKGYIINATTITQCLHSFCRSCMVQYVGKGELHCPQCRVLIHPSDPYVNLRLDSMVQDIVYKLVPLLQEKEAALESEYYKSHNLDHPKSGSTASTAKPAHTRKRRVYANAIRRIYVCLHYAGTTLSLSTMVKPLYKKFLSVPSKTTVRDLKSFVAKKFMLTHSSQVQIFVDTMMVHQSLTLEIIQKIFHGHESQSAVIDLNYIITKARDYFDPTNNLLEEKLPIMAGAATSIRVETPARSAEAYTGPVVLAGTAPIKQSALSSTRASTSSRASLSPASLDKSGAKPSTSGTKQCTPPPKLSPAPATKTSQQNTESLQSVRITPPQLTAASPMKQLAESSDEQTDVESSPSTPARRKLSRAQRRWQLTKKFGVKKRRRRKPQESTTMLRDERKKGQCVTGDGTEPSSGQKDVGPSSRQRVAEPISRQKGAEPSIEQKYMQPNTGQKRASEPHARQKNNQANSDMPSSARPQGVQFTEKSATPYSEQNGRKLSRGSMPAGQNPSKSIGSSKILSMLHKYNLETGMTKLPHAPRSAHLANKCKKVFCNKNTVTLGQTSKPYFESQPLNHSTQTKPKPTKIRRIVVPRHINLVYEDTPISSTVSTVKQLDQNMQAEQDAMSQRRFVKIGKPVFTPKPNVQNGNQPPKQEILQEITKSLPWKMPNELVCDMQQTSDTSPSTTAAHQSRRSSRNCRSRYKKMRSESGDGVPADNASSGMNSSQEISGVSEMSVVTNSVNSTTVDGGTSSSCGDITAHGEKNGSRELMGLLKDNDVGKPKVYASTTNNDCAVTTKHKARTSEARTNETMKQHSGSAGDAKNGSSELFGLLTDDNVGKFKHNVPTTKSDCDTAGISKTIDLCKDDSGDDAMIIGDPVDMSTPSAADTITRHRSVSGDRSSYGEPSPSYDLGDSGHEELDEHIMNWDSANEAENDEMKAIKFGHNVIDVDDGKSCADSSNTSVCDSSKSSSAESVIVIDDSKSNGSSMCSEDVADGSGDAMCDSTKAKCDKNEIASGDKRSNNLNDDRHSDVRDSEKVNYVQHNGYAEQNDCANNEGVKVVTKAMHDDFNHQDETSGADKLTGDGVRLSECTLNSLSATVST